MLNPTAYQPGLVFHNNAWKTSNQIVNETNMIAGIRPLTDQFPVSTGLQHKTSDVGVAPGTGGVAAAADGSGGNVFARQVGVVFMRGGVARFLFTALQENFDKGQS